MGGGIAVAGLGSAIPAKVGCTAQFAYPGTRRFGVPVATVWCLRVDGEG
jgi:hypothetical protein